MQMGLAGLRLGHCWAVAELGWALLGWAGDVLGWARLRGGGLGCAAV